MTTVSLRAAGAADPDEVWERYAVPSRWREWSPQISRVEYVPARITAGTVGRVHGPVGVFIDFTIDSVDAETREWCWTVRRGPLRLRLVHGVTVAVGGSATSLCIEGPLPVVLGYAPLARFALGRLVRP